MTLFELFHLCLDNLSLEKHIYCGFSGNLDWVVRLKNNQFLDFQHKTGLVPDFLTSRYPQPQIVSLSDLVDFVIYHLHDNLGGEGNLQNTDVISQLERFFTGIYAVGGTGAQAANTLAEMGFENIHLHLPAATEYLKKVLHNRIDIISNQAHYEKLFGTDLSLLTELHCVFDFATGTSYRMGSELFQTHSPDRVIISYDCCNAELQIARAFAERITTYQDASLLVSGFNSVRKLADLPRFLEDVDRVVTAFRTMNPARGLVHLEEGDHWEQETEKRVLIFSHAYPLADSVGMNRKEFETVKREMGITHASVQDVLMEIAARYDLQRVIVHDSNGCQAVSTLSFERELLIQGFGILLSSARAYHGCCTHRERIEQYVDKTRHISTKRVIPEPQWIDRDTVFTYFPTMKGIPVASSLGLGDSFTGGMMAFL